MLHVCRDFRTSGTNLNIAIQHVVNYYLAIFARTVVGYTIVGQTNFNIDSATYRKTTGAAGMLNLGVGNEYVFDPNNGYSVTAADIGRILAVKSVSYGMINSGLFRVTGVDTALNRFVLNYRSGDTPPAETGLTFALYEEENTFYSNLNFTGNGAVSGYTGTGAATQNRIILQSPSSLSWQVRLATENSTDAGSTGGTSPFGSTPISGGATVAPGYGGTAAGDFAAGGQHLHNTMFLNARAQVYVGTTVGWWPSNTNQSRIYMWGDDVTGTIFAAARGVITSGTDSFVHFGLPEDEELPLPPKNIQRLFVIGANSPSNNGDNGIYWACGGSALRGGIAFGLSNQPISCIYSLYNRLDGGTYTSAGIRGSTFAADNPYLRATELLPVDLVVGTHDNQSIINGTPESLLLEGRRLGRAPLVRLGRSNYGAFQVSVDSTHSWLHLADGIYLPWQGSILP